MTNTPNKTVEAVARAIAKALNPALWDSDPDVRHRAASPRTVEAAQAHALLTATIAAQAAYDTVIERLMEPTPEMLNAGYAAYTFGAADTIKMVRSIHKAMLTASKGANDA